MYSLVKRILVGPPLASSEEQHQRLGKPTALAVFASDALSSTAYATEEILLVLVPAIALASLEELIPIAVIVAVLLFLVINSYRQTVHAYPGGAGSYVVSRENLGTTPSLVAGASVLVDYVLTVAVSISAGAAAIDSAFPSLREFRVPICLAFVALLMLMNLRGVKESGRLFAGPTYGYIIALALLIGYGLYQVFFRDLNPLPPNFHALEELTNEPPEAFDSSGNFLSGHTLPLLLLLRAFSSGAVALSGVEAISDGVAAFRRPESKNAAITLVLLGLILGSSFLGISVLAHELRPTVEEGGETLLSIMGAAVFGRGTIVYYLLQFSTFAILILAANTAFADFPRVSSLIAADGFLPRQLATRGDRLVFSNGVVVLSVVAAILLVVFKGETSALIPLYAVGVFTGFTLSQTGMVRYFLREKGPGWRLKLANNAVGAVATLIVLIVVIVSKAAIGAWIPVVLIPTVMLMFKAVRRHYDRVSAAIRVPEGYRSKRYEHTVVVLVANVHKGVLNALTYARSLHANRLVAVTVVHDPLDQQRIEAQWAEFEVPVDLRILYSPYRELTQPVMQFIEELDSERPDDIVTVIVPEFIVGRWWEQLLHNQSALMLRSRLRMRRNTVVVAVPLHIDDAAGDDANAY